MVTDTSSRSRLLSDGQPIAADLLATHPEILVEVLKARYLVPGQGQVIDSEKPECQVLIRQEGTGHLLARKLWILPEAEFTFGLLHKCAGYAHEHPECEPHGMPRRLRRLQVLPT